MAISHVIQKTGPILPIPKVVPDDNESCRGYIIRLAAATGYPSPTYLFQLEPILRSPQNKKKEQIAESLIRLIGLSTEETKFLNNSLLVGEHISEVHYSNRMRVCPECLKEKEILDCMWEVVFVSVCPYHRILLIDKCPKCSSYLSWNMTRIKWCKCGSDFTQMQTVPVDPTLLYYNTKMWAAMGRDDIPDSPLPDIDDELLSRMALNKLCDLYRFLYRIGSKNQFNTSSRLKSISDVVNAFQVIHSLLADWPSGLYRYLESLRDESGAFKGEGLQQSFGHFYRGLYDDEEFEFIKEAFEDYVRTKWKGVIDGKYTRITSALRCNYTLIGNMSKKFNVSRTRLNKLIDSGLMVGEKKPRASGRCYTILKRCEVGRFSRLKKYLLNKKQTCQMMGISHKAFDVLVTHNIIKPITKAGSGGFASWWCDSRRLKVLLRKIIVMVPKTNPPADAVSFTQICQAHLTTVNLLPEFLHLIKAGQIHVAGMNINKTGGQFRLSSLFFWPDEIAEFRKNFIKKNTSRKSYSIPEMARLMKIKQEVAYYLINQGYLPTHEDLTRMQKGRVVSFSDIVAFEQLYIPLSKMASIQRTSPAALFRRLVKMGILPAIDGKRDGCRQIFYYRKELPSTYLREL
ncbi:TniQ family protein [Pelotalea chapellei]|uniref:TniQ family protein n=1 Tax=Pelotalea chapellei TaxID=44671 RepID=A0ABS5U4X3_9BACT|nr:TniQ family protein [Pelotalea chapellei]MBT1070689.1 TniQ family protein [Pelotalea chapellei]